MDAHRHSCFECARFRALALATGLAVLVTLASCWNDNGSGTSDTGATLAALRLNTLQSCDAFQRYVADSLVEQYRPRGEGVVWALNGEADAAAPATESGGHGSGSTASPSHVTGTNVQEAGVDEPDIVKTDADGVLYIARGTTLRIVAGHPPAQLRELAALDAGGAVYDLFLDESNRRAVLFAERHERMAPASPPNITDAGMPYFEVRVHYVISFVDVANPAQPTLTARWTLDGRPLDVRRVDARAHVVLTNPIELPAALADDTEFWKLYNEYYAAPTDEDAAAIAQRIEAAIRAAVAALDVAALLPAVTVETDETTSTGPIVGCEAINAPTVLTLPNLLTVASFDSDGDNLRASAILAHGSTVYASAENTYITQSSGGWFHDGEYKPQTAIHKFSVSGAAPVYVATGVVDGWARNTFNLSEYNGDLRVATNTTTWSKGTVTQTNDLFVLRDNGAGELAQRGAVRGFGEGEALFSARFLGTRGFVVTFRRVDPLFAFDLSDPDAPRLVDDLTIPGFSTYMHPLGDNHLLTIGRDGSARAIQLQIFDVTNLAALSLVTAYPISLPDGSSYSAAEYDHHAFTFDALNNVLAIPLSYADYTAGQYFNGIAAFKVDTAAGISEIVRVDHGDLANASHCAAVANVVAPCNVNYWYQAVPRRSILMTAGDDVTLYTVSDAGVKATDLAPPHDTLGSVVFPAEPEPQYEPPVPVAE